MNPLIQTTLTDALGWLHGRKKRDIYVLLSDDGSTLIQDPGLNRPWSTPNKKYADDTAADFRRKGVFCRAVTLELALAQVIKHPKNMPDGRS